MLKPLFSLIFIFSSTLALAKAGPAIPVPTHSAVQAIQLVDGQFRNTKPDAKIFAESSDLKLKDFIVSSAEYTKSFEEKPLGEWSWIVTLVHPIHNDHTYTFQLKANGKIVLLSQTI